MSIATLDFFQSASLKQRYSDELDTALQDVRIHSEEHAWLLSLTDPAASDPADPVRVDGLFDNGGSLDIFELAAALLLSHGMTDTPRVYLYTLSHGIEVFADRYSLLIALRARFAANDAEVLFEYQKIDGDPFHAQMLAIIDNQVEHVSQLASQLKASPTLIDACTASLADQLRQSLPHMPLDPSVHLLQVTSQSGVDGQSTLITQTLAQAAFDDWRKVVLAQDFERRFLDSRGLPANASDARMFTSAMANAVLDVASSYQALMTAYWQTHWTRTRTRRDLAIESFNSSLRRELYSRHAEADFDPAIIRTLLRLTGREASPQSEHDDASVVCHALSVRIGDGRWCPLAAMFLVQTGAGARPALWLFSTNHRFARFADSAALTDFFASVQGRAQLRVAMALDDQPCLLLAGALQLRMRVINTTIAADRVDSVISVQACNLAYGMRHGCEPEHVSAMIDDALDVRQLLDPRQLQLTGDRWRKETPFQFSDVWPAPQSPALASPPASTEIANAAEPDVAAQGDPSEESALSWVEQIQFFDARSQRLRKQDSVLLAYAEQTLQRFLCVLIDDAAPGAQVQVQWLESSATRLAGTRWHAVPISESQQMCRMDLVSLLLERVSGLRPALLADTRVTLITPLATHHLQAELINRMLDHAAAGFTDHYAQAFVQSRCGLQRVGDKHLQPFEEALSVREDTMRLDLALRSRRDWIDEASSTMARQVLDRPDRALRLALDEPLTEACSISVVFGNGQSAVLCDTLALMQPSRPQNPGMLWCGEFGWRSFVSVERLQRLLQRKLRGGTRERWMGLMQERDQTRLREHLDRPSGHRVHIRLDRIAGHAIKAVQRQVTARASSDLQQMMSRAIRCQFESTLLIQRANACELDWLMGAMLDGLSVRIDNSLFEAMMPPWLSTAPTAELGVYYDLLTRYYLASDGGRDYLFDIAPLHGYARQRLITQLQLDFPAYVLDPDQITLTSRRYISAFPSPGALPSAVAAAAVNSRESLTDYAINRFAGHQGAVVSVDPVQHTQTLPGLTPAYLRQLVRTLDVGAGYIAMLGKSLAPGDAQYLERNRLFVEQSAPMLLAVAYGEKLKGNLSTQGYRFVSHVLEMPDGIAREPVGTTPVIISPLQLVADAGMTPDPVMGAYVICADRPHDGPVVLFAIHYSAFTFKEFPNLEALMQEIRVDRSLQALVLERLAPDVRRRYAHDGFTEPHLPFSVEGLDDIPFSTPGPVSFGLDEFKGNALQLLFEDTVKLLLDSGVTSAVTNEQDDHASRLFLGALGLEQILSLMPGKLAAMVMLWQTQTLFRASAASAVSRRWGEALSEFSAALGVMVSAREQSLEDQLSEDQAATDVASQDDENTFQEVSSSWGSPSLSAEQRTRLQGLEARNVALDTMQHDPLLNLYRHSADQALYAVVGGKVYPVRYIEQEGDWFIKGADDVRGPRVFLDTQQHWQLDLSLRLRGGGGFLSRHKLDQVERDASDAMVIEATGMTKIRKLYRDRARRIVQAHAHAKRYLENALDNLSPQLRPAALDPRVTAIVSEFFGVPVPDKALLGHTEETIKSLFTAITDPSLSPFSSPRFVVGVNRPGNDAINAFIVPRDPQRRVFLTEQFFNVPRYALTPQASSQGFESAGHYRAAILIHELSHQALDTYDIAYLESMAPYPDLMLADTASNLKMKSHVKRLHDYRLAPRSVRENLFQIHDKGQWRDIKPRDDRGYEAIINLSEVPTLNEARDVFLSDPVKRARIMLSNADSVTLLALRLGRRNFVLPTP